MEPPVKHRDWYSHPDITGQKIRTISPFWTVLGLLFKSLRWLIVLGALGLQLFFILYRHF